MVVDKNKMYCVEQLEGLIETVIYSGWLKDRRPLSLILVATKGSGKTETSLQYVEDAPMNKQEVASVQRIDNFTPTGFDAHGAMDLVAARKLKTIVMPEFVRMFQNRSTVDMNISFLCSVTEEGGGASMTAVTRRGKGTVRGGIGVGIIGGMTPENFKRYRPKLEESGFLDRVLVVNYGNSVFVQKTIRKAIVKNNSSQFHPAKVIWKPKTLQTVECPLSIRNKIDSMVEEFKMGDQLRQYHKFVTYVMANALRNKRNKVTMSDWLFLRHEVFDLLRSTVERPWIIVIPGKCQFCGAKVKKTVYAQNCKKCAKKVAIAEKARIAKLKAKVSPPSYSTGRRLKE